MSLGVLNNISAIYAENNLNQTQGGLQKTLQQLSSGSRINSGADDAAGLSLANGLQASSTALSQSAKNASEGVDLLQVADGAMAQVTNLLNRAVTLATEAANGTLSASQQQAANAEYQSILGELDTINSTTEYNGILLFDQGASSGITIFTSDGTISTTYGVDGGSNPATAAPLAGVDSGSLGVTTTLDSTDLWSTAATTAANALDATAALQAITEAISQVAGDRGTVGAGINVLTAVENVQSTQSTNTLSAENDVTATDYGQATSDMAKYQILMQTGIAALAQANSTQQLVTKLLQ